MHVKIVIGLALIAGCFAQTREVVLRTSAAEFRVLSSGYVAGSLLGSGGRLTLDDRPASEFGDRVVIDGKPAPDTSYDLRAARREIFPERAGRGQRVILHALVRLGPGAALDKVLTIETRESVPNVAMITLGLKNTGRRELHVDRVEYGRHRFNAQQTEPSAQPWDVWSFLGTSTQWGEVEIARVGRDL